MSAALDADLPIEHRVMIAYRAARNRPDVGGQIYSVLDAQLANLKRRLGVAAQLRGNLNASRSDVEAANAQVSKLLVETLAEFERWRDMDAQQVPAALGALVPQPPAMTAQQYANVQLQDLRRRGLRLTEAHRGEVRVEPATALTMADRRFISENKDYLLRALRAEANAWSC